MLGRLARELRLLGIDAEYDRNLGGMAAFREARRTGRILLTRANKVRELPGVIFVQSQVPPEQVAQIQAAVEAGLKPAVPVVEQPPPGETPAPVEESVARPPAAESAQPVPEAPLPAPERPKREAPPVPEEPAFGRCLDCNTPLEKINREQARPSVPFFVYQIHHDFRRCPKCKKVYWPGNHVSDMQRRVAREPGRTARGARSGRRRN